MKAKRQPRRPKSEMEILVMGAALDLLAQGRFPTDALLTAKLHASSSTVSPILYDFRARGLLPKSPSHVSKLREGLRIRGAQIDAWTNWAASVQAIAHATGLELPPLPGPFGTMSPDPAENQP